MQNQNPNHWQKATLGDVCFPVSETFDFKNKRNFIFINTGDIEEGKFLHNSYFNDKHLPGQAKKSFRKSDILYSEIRPRNKHFAFIDFDAEEYVASTKLMVIRNKDNIDPEFLYLLLTNKITIDNFQTIAESRSGTFPQLTFDAISNYKIELPPLAEQRKIFEFMKFMSKKIELNNKIVKTLEEMAQAIFKEWFIYNRENGLKPTVKDFGKVVTGKTPSTTSKENFGSITPFITIPDMKNIFVMKTERKLSKNGVNKMHPLLLPSGSICVSCIATIGLVSLTTEESVTNQQINSIIPKKPEYIYFLYQALKGNKKILEAIGAGGSTTFIINKTQFENLAMYNADDETIKKFHRVVEPMYKKILEIAKVNQKLTAMRDLLLPKLMKGEIRV